MTLFHNKYRIESARLKGWDYSSDGYYFITVCAKNRDNMFGEIIDGGMVLNDEGEVVKMEWMKSFEIRRELSCDCFVIMPNHIHGIIEITCRDARPCVSTAKPSNIIFGGNNMGVAKRLPKSISSFVAGFKSSVTKKINQLHHTPNMAVWQTRFHDRIIRDDNELNRIREYIIMNPENWETDEHFIQDGNQ